MSFGFETGIFNCWYPWLYCPWSVAQEGIWCRMWLVGHPKYLCILRRTVLSWSVCYLFLLIHYLSSAHRLIHIHLTAGGLWEPLCMRCSLVIPHFTQMTPWQHVERSLCYYITVIFTFFFKKDPIDAEIVINGGRVEHFQVALLYYCQDLRTIYLS